ncbi:MAG: flagellar hook-length control protein FliK [Spirochaetes bacterium]|nr:flagellar hook-length control protein FliK [Spirochaetota bacterium]
MLHISTIAVAKNNAPESALPRPLVSTGDFSSDAGFFSMLRSQVEPIDTAPPNVRQQNDMTQRPSGDENRPRSESIQPRAKENDTPQALKDKPEEQRKPETAESADVAKASGNAEAQVKGSLSGAEKTIEPSAGEKTRESRRLTESKAGPADHARIHAVIEELGRMILSAAGNEGRIDFTKLKESLKELRGALSRERGNPEMTRLAAAVDALLKRLGQNDAAALPGGFLRNLAKTVAGIREMIARQKGAEEKGAKHAGTSDPGTPQVKDLPNRVAAILEGMKQEGSETRQGGQGSGGSSHEGVISMKGESTTKLPDMPAAQHRAGLFRESLERIIERAQVTVKNGRNASFSVRLNPPELGNLNIHLGLHDGVVHGRFLVTTQEARDLLMADIEQIKQQLGEAGISIGEFQVNVNDQRGRTLHEREGESVYIPAPGEQAAVIEDEYRANAAPAHDGHINVII